MKCPNCNALIRDEVKFCTECGIEMPEMEIVERELSVNTTALDRRDFFRILLGAAVGCAVFVGVDLFISMLFDNGIIGRGLGQILEHINGFIMASCIMISFRLTGGKMRIKSILTTTIFTMLAVFLTGWAMYAFYISSAYGGSIYRRAAELDVGNVLQYSRQEFLGAFLGLVTNWILLARKK